MSSIITTSSISSLHLAIIPNIPTGSITNRKPLPPAFKRPGSEICILRRFGITFRAQDVSAERDIARSKKIRTDAILGQLAGHAAIVGLGDSQFHNGVALVRINVISDGGNVVPSISFCDNVVAGTGGVNGRAGAD